MARSRSPAAAGALWEKKSELLSVHTCTPTDRGLGSLGVVRTRQTSEVLAESAITDLN
jgi:hypothetical protein